MYYCKPALRVNCPFYVASISEAAFARIKANRGWAPTWVVSDGLNGAKEWRFKDAAGRLYNVYTRDGRPRVSGYEDTSPADVARFEAWILKNS